MTLLPAGPPISARLLLTGLNAMKRATKTSRGSTFGRIHSTCSNTYGTLLAAMNSSVSTPPSTGGGAMKSTTSALISSSTKTIDPIPATK